jgi:hypothetical protein
MLRPHSTKTQAKEARAKQRMVKHEDKHGKIFSVSIYNINSSATARAKAQHTTANTVLSIQLLTHVIPPSQQKHEVQNPDPSCISQTTIYLSTFPSVIRSFFNSIHSNAK